MIPLRGTPSPRRIPVVTILLIVVNVAVFGLQVATFLRGGTDRILDAALVPRELARHPGPRTLATILTSMFLHADPVHLVGNLWFLWVFGSRVEDAMGRLRYPLFYFFAGIVAALIQVASDPASRTPMIGASGAIAGVLGAHAVLFPGARISALIPIIPFLWMPIVRMRAWIFLLAWFAMQWIGFRSADPGAEGVAWMAHIGGFGAGALLAFSFGRRRR